MPFISQDASATNQASGFRNRVINGNMRIDQRNVGAAVPLNAAASYITDRFYCNNALSVSTIFQQGILGNNGFPSRIANQPFTHCLTWTNSSTASTATNSVIYVTTMLEGNSVVDLNWGLAGARMITLSFWAYVSVAGTYSVCLQNSGFLTGYVTTFQVTTANAWQKINISISGPVIGAWSTDTGIGIAITFVLHGSTASFATSSLNTWQTTSTQYYISTTQTNLALIASSTFSITGLQLEVGTVATQFEWRPWETEMRMCQRCYEKSCVYSSLPLTADANGCITTIAQNAYFAPGGRFAVEKRIVPTARVWATVGAATAGTINVTNASTIVTGIVLYQMNTKGYTFVNGGSGQMTSGTWYQYHYDAGADF